MDTNIIEKNLPLKLNKKSLENFENFAQLFKIYNSHTNLISKNDEKNLFEKHIYDSLCISLFINKYIKEDSIKILDIGTGGGFPSIPVAIAYNNFQIYPLDSIAKKIGFIELVQKELRLDNLHPICKRVEELPQNSRESFDIVTSRAVAPLNILLEYAIPFVKNNGYFVAFKSKNSDNEINTAQNALKILNSKIIERIKYNLPTEQLFSRELLIIKKEKETPSIYPRKSGQAKKNPL